MSTKYHIVKISGKYTGMSSGNSPLVGILISGERALLKWLYCEKPELLEKIKSFIPEGSEVTVKIKSSKDGKKNYLIEIEPRRDTRGFELIPTGGDGKPIENLPLPEDRLSEF